MGTKDGRRSHALRRVLVWPGTHVDAGASDAILAPHGSIHVRE